MHKMRPAKGTLHMRDYSERGAEDFRGPRTEKRRKVHDDHQGNRLVQDKRAGPHEKAEIQAGLRGNVQERGDRAPGRSQAEGQGNTHQGRLPGRHDRAEMMRTAKNILRHELIGLQCEIMSSNTESQIGIKGKIVDETMKTIVIRARDSEKRVQKRRTIFRLKLDDNTVDVEGTYLVSPPH